MGSLYPSSVCPSCGKLVENVPPHSRVRDFCKYCTDYAPRMPEGELAHDNNIIKDAKVFECKVRCPDCNQKIEMDISLLGQAVRCPFCNQKIAMKL